MLRLYFTRHFRFKLMYTTNASVRLVDAYVTHATLSMHVCTFVYIVLKISFIGCFLRIDCVCHHHIHFYEIFDFSENFHASIKFHIPKIHHYTKRANFMFYTFLWCHLRYLVDTSPIVAGWAKAVPFYQVPCLATKIVLLLQWQKN